MFKPGTLWASTVQQTERALESGALKPIMTESVFVRDRGIDFLVRTVSSLARKAEAREKQRAQSYSETKRANPFLPHEREMFVADLSATHLCLLNKFNVIDHHLLIVTRTFQEQEQLLNLEDFESLWTCMAEFDGLGFYNGGEEAGASQRHKHLQIVPLPLADRGPKLPIEPMFQTAEFTGPLGVVPALPFIHSIAKLEPDFVSDPRKAALDTYRLYRLMLEKVGLNKKDAASNAFQAGPYNLLLTREWMLVLPRAREFYESISVNALGFVGAMLVKGDKQMRALRKTGPMRVLAHTGAAK
jgi:ATP adenylyltransferase